MARGKTFELLDFPKFAVPSVIHMDAVQTSQNLIDRLGGKSFMSVCVIWSRMPDIVGGYVAEPYIKKQFEIYDDGSKNESIRDAVRLLAKHFGGRGRWYPMPSRPLRCLASGSSRASKGFGMWMGQRTAVLINARKSQPLQRGTFAFPCARNLRVALR